MNNWDFLEQHRVTGHNRDDKSIPPCYWSNETYGFNGMFRFWVKQEKVRCIASDGEGWKHVSISIEGDNRPPKWEVTCIVKDLFWNDEDWVCQFHPAKSEYVNQHPGCLHLWQPTQEKLPTPASILVGIK